MKKRDKVVDDLKAFYTVDREDEGGKSVKEMGKGDEEEEEGDKQKGWKKGEGKQSKKAQPDPRFQLRPEQHDDEEEEDEQDEEEEEEEEDEDDGCERKKKDDKMKKKSSSSHNEAEDRLEYLNRLARGEISDTSTSSSTGSSSSFSSSSENGDSSGSESDDEEDKDDDNEDEDVIESRKLEEGPIPMGEATSRIAIMNCDWEHLKALDILGILVSFKPGEGKVERVRVYVSDYGKEKMEEDARRGPGFMLKEGGRAEEEEIGNEGSVDSEENEEEEEGGGEQVDQEMMRAYEVQKLRYYFAVAECDSVSTASKLYDEVDGLEFENSSSQVDVRFIPPEVEFEGREVRDEVSGGSLPVTYEPPVFVTKALQQTKVECTWEAGDGERERRLTQYHRWHEMEEDDLGAYLASSSN
eukprot:evm.model.NODE_31089_length_21432_cov_25.446669.3